MKLLKYDIIKIIVTRPFPTNFDNIGVIQCSSLLGFMHIFCFDLLYNSSCPFFRLFIVYYKLTTSEYKKGKETK